MRPRLLVLPLLVLALLGAGCVHEHARTMFLRHYETGETLKGTANFTTNEITLTLSSGEVLKGVLSESHNGQAQAELTTADGKLRFEVFIGINSRGDPFGEARTNDGRHFTVLM